MRRDTVSFIAMSLIGGAQAQHAALANTGVTPVWKGKRMADFTVADVECLSQMHHVKWCAYSKNFMSNDSFSREQLRARPASRFSTAFSNASSRAKATPSIAISENAFRMMAARGVLVADLPPTHVVTKRKGPMDRGEPQLKPRSNVDGGRQPPLQPDVSICRPLSVLPHARVASCRVFIHGT